MGTQKDIQIPWEGKTATVTIRKLGWGEKQMFMEQHFPSKLSGTRTVNIDIGCKPFEMRRNAMLKSLVTAPFPMTQEYIDNEMDQDVGEVIYTEIQNLNGFELSIKKKEKLEEKSSGPTSTEPTTPPSGDTQPTS